MDNSLIFLVFILTVAMIATFLNVKAQSKARQQENASTELSLPVQKKWSIDEYIVIAFYVLYKKEGNNQKLILETIADGMCRTKESVRKKVSVFNNIETRGINKNLMERTIYDELKYIGEKEAGFLVDDAVASIIELNPQ
jgi:ABC-type transport system involved in multi-copper enzyme maturation permease subunit